MKTKLIQIGNSRGIRIPKALIEHMKLNGTVELEIRGEELVLRAAAKPAKAKNPPNRREPRAGWDAAFRKAIKKYGPPKIDHEWLDAPLIEDSRLGDW
jgi:antitoxin MazE